MKTKEELRNFTLEKVDNGLKVLGYFKDDKLVGFLAYEIKEMVTKYIWIDEFLINHIRKFAHFVEYLILGIIVSKYYYFKKRSIYRLINSIFLVLSIAFLVYTIQII